MAKSLRSAINAFCKACIFDREGASGSWRQQVEACPSLDCPLYPVRPKSSPKQAVTTLPEMPPVFSHCREGDDAGCDVAARASSELAAFYANPENPAHYAGRFVAVHDGEVIASDENEGTVRRMVAPQTMVFFVEGDDAA